MQTRHISIVGKVSKLKESEAQRLSAFVLRGNQVLATGPLQPDGSYRMNLARDAAAAESAYGLTVAIAPSTAGDHLDHFPEIQRISLNREKLAKAEREFRAHEISISEEALRIWWLWCRWYCVSGIVVGPDGCPAPAAEVTVHTVSHTLSGYSKVARTTVTTAPNGTFNACFEWCNCSFCFPCWPCWPIWWECWPWWWEFDLLHVIKTLELQPIPHGPGPVEQLATSAVLVRPDAKQLARGQGFAFARTEEFAPSAARTQLIKNKLANPALREIFPWHWWCCDDPNIVFSVKQNGTVILDENPALHTRWCFEEGSSVTLVGSRDTITLCSPPPPIESGFLWTDVGDIDVADISPQGYANGSAGGDNSDMAFAGSLDLFGSMAGSSGVAYYQVQAAPWTGTKNPARGGTPPAAGTASPVAATLVRHVWIYKSDHVTLDSESDVVMGPFNQGGLVNLYATEASRQSGPTPPGLNPFPTVPAGGLLFWNKPMILQVNAPVLLGGGLTGGVDLTFHGYEATLSEVTLVPDAPLTLMIDASGLTTAEVTAVRAYLANGTPATQTGTGDCPAYDVHPDGYVQIDVAVSDANGHLFGYRVDAEYGHDHTATVTPPGTRGYRSNPLSSVGDPNYPQKSWVGGQETMTFPGNTLGGVTPPDCCYEFRLYIGKRVTNGYDGPGLGPGDFQTISLKFSS